MKGGAENRKKTIIAGALVSAAVITFGVVMYNTFYGGSTTPPSAPVTTTATTTTNPARRTSTSSSEVAANQGMGVAAGVAATRLASTSASLDPTLDETAMLRTESLVYSGTGRNIFSATYEAPPLAIPTHLPPARKGPPPPPPPPPAPYVPPTCPPSCPPINLKFFGTATRPNGVRQAFLLEGEDVYLASQGDIVARKYKITGISASNIQVEDLSNHNTQTLPLTSN